MGIISLLCGFMSNIDINTALDQLTASLLILRADTAANLGAIEAISRACGLQAIDGLTVLQWHAKQRLVELEKALISLEDLDTALAAQIQRHIDQARKDFQG